MPVVFISTICLLKKTGFCLDKHQYQVLYVLIFEVVTPFHFIKVTYSIDEYSNLPLKSVLNLIMTNLVGQIFKSHTVDIYDCKILYIILMIQLIRDIASVALQGMQ